MRVTTRVIGLIVAVVLALFGSAALPLSPAAAAPKKPAAPQSAPTASPAAKAKAAAQAKAKARAKAAAQAKATAQARARAIKARDDYVALSGPRAAAAARAAATARARAATAARTAAQSRAAAASARALAAAKSRAAASPAAKTPELRKRAAGEAKQAAAASAKATALQRSTAAAATNAAAVASAQAMAATEARAVYVALAGPRAVLAARQAAVARKRASAAAKAVGPARSRASVAAAAAAAARVSAAAVAKSKASAKDKKRAAVAAASAVRASQAANARVQASVAAATGAASAARALKAAAAKAKKAAGPNAFWRPSENVLFNYPRGSKKKKYTLITQLNRAIDATPAGGQIRMAMYLFDIDSVADKLIAAHRRGVSVQILLDDNTMNRDIRRVKRALGTNKRARSFFAVCDHSCMSNGTSTIHSKFYLFSSAGASRYVSLISSGNPYSGNTSKSWNNTHTVVNNKTIYSSLSKYFTDMLPDKNRLNYYRTTTSGKYTVYYYPQKIRKADDLIWMHTLNRVSCTNTAAGYGTKKKRTMIRVANWGWTSSRIDVAKRLWKLHDSGCSVQVMVNSGRISRSVLKVLLKRSKKYGRMPVYNAWRDWRKKAVAGLYVHHKFITINGVLSGKNVKLTLTGSQNFTALGTTANNDLVLRVVDATMTRQYNDNFTYIRAHYTRRMHSVPLITRVPDRVGGA